jgi:hypothetical protein
MYAWSMHHPLLLLIEPLTAAAAAFALTRHRFLFSLSPHPHTDARASVRTRLFSIIHYLFIYSY